MNKRFARIGLRHCLALYIFTLVSTNAMSDKGGAPQPMSNETQQIDSLMALEQFPEALRIVDHALATDGHTSQLFRLRSRILQAMDSSQAAENALRRAIELSTRCAECHHDLAHLKLQRQDYAGALIQIDSALLLNTPTAERHFLRALALNGLERYSSAVLALRDACRLDSGRGDYRAEKAILNYRLGYDFIALQDFNKAIALLPDAALLYTYRGQLLFRQQRYGDALRDYNQAIELGIRDTEVFYARGVIRYQLDSVNSALNDYNSALGLDSTFHPALYERGRVYYDRNDMARFCGNLRLADFHSAGMYMRDLSEYCDSSSASFYWHWGMAAFNKGDARSALQYYSRGLILSGPDSWGLMLKGQALRALGREDSALGAFSEALDRAPDNGTLYLMRGETLLALHRFDLALRDLSQAQLLDSSSYFNDRQSTYSERLHLARASAYSQSDQARLAILAFSDLIACKPRGALAYARRAAERMKVDDLPDALADARQAIAFDADLAEGHFILGRVKLRIELPDFCEDLRRAAALQHAEAAKLLRQLCGD